MNIDVWDWRKPVSIVVNRFVLLVVGDFRCSLNI